MAGALIRAAPRVIAPLGRAAGSALAYYALDGAIDAVNEWLEKRQWQKRERHRGLDLPAPIGTPVLSPTDAIVIGQQTTPTGGQELFLAGPRLARGDASDPNRWPRQYAWFARGDVESGRDEALVDDSGWRFGFAHLSGVNVQVGTVVRRGQQIATTGNSGTTANGQAYGPHLHLTSFWVQDGLRDVHVFVDPALLIPGVSRGGPPVAKIGPGTFLTVCILTRVSTREQAMTRVVVQQFPTGLGVNWAETLKGVS